MAYKWMRVLRGLFCCWAGRAYGLIGWAFLECSPVLFLACMYAGCAPYPVTFTGPWHWAVVSLFRQRPQIMFAALYRAQLPW